MGRVRSDAGEQDLVRVYLDSIGWYALLSKEEEARLAQEMEAGRAAAELELGTRHRRPQERDSWNGRCRGGERAADQFINSNLRLVVSIAKRTSGRTCRCST